MLVAHSQVEVQCSSQLYTLTTTPALQLHIGSLLMVYKYMQDLQQQLECNC